MTLRVGWVNRCVCGLRGHLLLQVRESARTTQSRNLQTCRAIMAKHKHHAELHDTWVTWPSVTNARCAKTKELNRMCSTKPHGHGCRGDAVACKSQAKLQCNANTAEAKANASYRPARTQMRHELACRQRVEAFLASALRTGNYLVALVGLE
jgi:hypothetical protein